MSAKVSYVILNRDRKERLRQTLLSVYAQDYAEREVIVADNGSTDGSVEMVHREFPECRVLDLGKNLGIAGRNAGMRAATGDFIFSLDNDIEIPDPAATRKLLLLFERHPSVAILTLKIVSPAYPNDYADEHWWHPFARKTHQDRMFLTPHFNEAAVLFRHKALVEAGYYYEPLFWAFEEWDLSLRLINRGYDILYTPDIKVIHLEPRGMIGKIDPRVRLNIKNKLWIAFRNLPLEYAFVYALGRIAVGGTRAIWQGYGIKFCSGVLDFILLLPGILKTRQSVSRATMKRIAWMSRSPRLPG